jgi:hypothetical protein
MMKARDKVQMFDDISRLGLDTHGEDLAVGVVLLAAHSLNAARHRAQRQVGATMQRRGSPSTVVLEVADGIGNCDQPAKRMRWCFAHTLSQSCTATESFSTTEGR